VRCPMSSPCPRGPTGSITLPNGRACVDLARSEDRRPRQIFGFLKNLGTEILSHSRPVPVGAVATIVPRLPGRVVRVNMWLATQIQGRS
jgi:hypothetical protein